MKKCIRQDDKIAVGDQVIQAMMKDGLHLAHDKCTPNCPKCNNEILTVGPYSGAVSVSIDNGKPVIEHLVCPPH